MVDKAFTVIDSNNLKGTLNDDILFNINLYLLWNEFEVDSNSKTTPVGKPVLNKDLNGKPRKLSWKYRTVVGMLNYLPVTPDLK